MVRVTSGEARSKREICRQTGARDAKVSVSRWVIDRVWRMRVITAMVFTYSVVPRDGFLLVILGLAEALSKSQKLADAMVVGLPDDDPGGLGGVLGTGNGLGNGAKRDGLPGLGDQAGHLLDSLLIVFRDGRPNKHCGG